MQENQHADEKQIGCRKSKSKHGQSKILRRLYDEQRGAGGEAYHIYRPFYGLYRKASPGRCKGKNYL